MRSLAEARESTRYYFETPDVVRAWMEQKNPQLTAFFQRVDEARRTQSSDLRALESSEPMQTYYDLIRSSRIKLVLQDANLAANLAAWYRDVGSVQSKDMQAAIIATLTKAGITYRQPQPVGVP